MNGQPILVQMADTKWTTAALRTALAHAREVGRGVISEVLLVKFLPAAFLNWQTDDAANYHFSESDQEELVAYQAVAAEYAVPLREIAWKYDHHLETGIIEAADKLNAESVFINLPHGTFPLLHHREVNHLGHVLEEHHHHMFTVDQPAAPVDWTPTAEEYHDPHPHKTEE